MPGVNVDAGGGSPGGHVGGAVSHSILVVKFGRQRSALLVTSLLSPTTDVCSTAHRRRPSITRRIF